MRRKTMMARILEEEARNLVKQPEKLKSLLFYGCIAWAEKTDAELEDTYLEMFGEKKRINQA